MLMTAATELGTTTWMPSILTQTTGVQGILFVVWIFGLMALGRAFAGPLIHKISPMGTLIGSSLFSIIGLYLISTATAAAGAFIGATVFAMGVCSFRKDSRAPALLVSRSWAAQACFRLPSFCRSLAARMTARPQLQPVAKPRLRRSKMPEHQAQESSLRLRQAVALPRYSKS
jgi:hypothetical protein